MEKDAPPSSRYTRFEKPVYDSKIPPHLLQGLDEKEKWLVTSVDLLNSKADWLVEKLIEVNAAVIDTDIRLQRVENWKTVLTGKWAVLAGVGVIVFTALAGEGAKHLFGKLFP